MNKADLANIKSDYELFNIILFNNSLPRANKIDFILHDLTFAAGYSRYRDKPSKTGNVHEIAFCKYHAFSKRQIQEILIHEMIHLWQVHHVAEWRYKRCSNDIAHDKVFTSKMNTINLILAKRGYDLTIKQVCDDKLVLDENIKPRVDYYVFFAESHGKHLFFKVKIKDFDKIVEKLNSDNYTKVFSNIYAIKTKSYLYNLLAFNKDIPEFAQESLNANTKEDLYDENNPENIWIIKNNEYIYSK